MIVVTMEDCDANQKLCFKNGRQLTIDSDGAQSNAPILFKSSNRQRKACNKLKFFMLLTFALLLILIILVVVHVFIVSNIKKGTIITNTKNGVNENQKGKGTNDTVCLSEQCVKISARILNSLDRSVDPCENFYQYSCGGWINDNDIPREKPNWDIFKVLTTRRNKLLKRYFENNMNNIDNMSSPAVSKLLKLYDSCMGNKSVKPFLNIVNEKIGGSLLTNTSWDPEGWDYFEKLPVIEKMVKRNVYGTKILPFLDSFVIADPFNSSRYVFQVAPPELSLLNTGLYYEKSGGNIREAYIDFMEKVAIQLGLSQANATKYMGEVFELEKKISKILPKMEELRNIKKTKKQITIKEFYEQTGKKFNWLKYINAVLSSIGLSLSDDDVIIVTSIEYMKVIVGIIENTTKTTMANYFAWTLLHNYIETLPQNFGDAHFEFLKIMRGLVDPEPRWEMCIYFSESYMGFALASILVKEAFNEDMKEEVSDLVKYIRSTFDERIKSNSWMDQPTKDQAMKKANAMLDNIAYPAFILDPMELGNLYKGVEPSNTGFFENLYMITEDLNKQNLKRLTETVNRATWEIPPTYVNAFYDVARNKMVFLAEILKPPFYSWKGPKSINFGGIGMVMGHEMIHGFDDQGRLFDFKSDMVDWWSKNSTDFFKARSRCFADQYSTYSKYGAYVNGNITLGENIADNGGLRISYYAYQKWLKEEGPDLKLPAVNLTNEQLFFVASAQIWCSKDRKQLFIQTLQTELHTPGEFRVKGMLSNSEEFTKAFKCKENSVMNPRTKCVIY